MSSFPDADDTATVATSAAKEAEGAPLREPANGALDTRFYDEELEELCAVRQRYDDLVARLELSERQLVSYAQDVKKAFDVMKQRAQALAAAHYDTLVRLLRAARFKDEETGAHLLRLSAYSRVLAAHLGLPREEVERIAAAAPLHDVGKIGIPDAILQKRGPLDANEWQVMKTHPSVGGSLLKSADSPLLQTAYSIALEHHERWDGSGYPRGLSGKKISLAGRIVMLADQYDALRSARPYKVAFTHERTFEIITKGDGRTLPAHFDPDVLAAFKERHEELEALFEANQDAADDPPPEPESRDAGRSD